MWYVLKSPALSLSVRDELNKENIDYYLPTHVELRNVGGQQKRVERPLMFNFVFVRAPFDDARDFCRNHPDLRMHVVYNHKPIHGGANAEPLVIHDREMDMFQKAILFYNGQEVPFVKADELDLEKGDEVRIIGGQFSGLEGVLLSQKGKDGGRVVVHLSNVVAVSTLEIEPEYLQILRFGKDNKHFYKHLDSYIPRLERALSVEGRMLTASELAPLKTFVSRFSLLQTETVNSEAKVYALLYASHKLLGNADEIRVLKEKTDAILPKLKSQTTIDFVKKWV